MSRNNKVRNNQPLTIDLCSHCLAFRLGKELMRTKESRQESVTLTRASHYPNERRNVEKTEKRN